MDPIIYLIPQCSDKDESTANLFAHLSEVPDPASDLASDIEIAFREGVTDAEGNCPDFVVLLEGIRRAFPYIEKLDIPNPDAGLVLRITATELDRAIDDIILFIAERCEQEYGTIEVCDLRVMPNTI